MTEKQFSKLKALVQNAYAHEIAIENIKIQIVDLINDLINEINKIPHTKPSIRPLTRPSMWEMDDDYDDDDDEPIDYSALIKK